MDLGLYIVIAVLNTVSMAIALYIALKLWRIGTIIKDTALETVSIGYFVLAIGLMLSSIAAMLALAYPIHPGIYGHSHYFKSTSMHGMFHEPPPWCGYKTGLSWSAILITSIVYPIAYLVILLGLRREHIPTSASQAGGATEGAGFGAGSSYTYLFTLFPVLRPVTLLGIVSDVLSVVILFVIVLSPFIASKETRIGYLLLLVSHVFRLVSVITVQPYIFLLGELIRPLGLLAIGLTLVRKH